MNACEQGLYQKAARQLSHDLTLVVPQFNAGEVEKAQTTWEDYLHSECGVVVYNFYYPGTVAPFEKAKCELQLTDDRITELHPLIHVQQDS